MLPPLTQDDKTALEELLRRKTEDITGGVKHEITLPLEVILAPSPEHHFFPHRVANINPGTTFAGILQYRGNIMTALKNNTPMQEWPEQAILAYFCSCVEKNLNFSKYHTARAMIFFKVEVFDMGYLSDLNVMSLDEPDTSYEEEVEEMMAKDADAMEVDEGLCVIDGADLNLWISKRGSGA